MQDQDAINQKEDRRQYELAYVLESTEGEALIKSALAPHDIQVVLKSVPEKFHLAYPIKKQTEGFFGFVKFVSSPDIIGQIDKKIRFINHVLRFMIIKSDTEIKEEVVSPEIKTEPEVEISIDEPASASRVSSSLKSSLSNEELKARLQEIS